MNPERKPGSVEGQARNVGGGNSSGVELDARFNQAYVETGDEETQGRSSVETSRFDDCPRTRVESRAPENQLRGYDMSGLLEPGSVREADIDAYADWTVSFWFSGKNRPEKESIAIMGLGLAGEAGEVVEHLKKFIRDDHINITELKKELGDSIYYWCRICEQFGLKPSEVLRANVEKLVSRHERGVLRGDGDNR